MFYIYIYICVCAWPVFVFFQSFLLQWLRRRSDESQAGLWWVDASQYEVMFQWLGWFEGTLIVGTPQLVTVLVIIYTNSICGLLLRFIVVLKQYEWQKTNCWPRFTVTVTDWLIHVVVRKIQKVFDQGRLYIVHQWRCMISSLLLPEMYLKEYSA